MLPLLPRLSQAVLRRSLALPTRTFTTTVPYWEKPLPPRPKIDENDITEAFLKGTGPGGQKINKTSSAVQLKHLPTGIVIKCQETRSRTQNRKIARRILAERIEERELGEGSRTAIKIERAVKKKKSADKKARRKYRKLAEGAEGAEDGKEDEHEEEDDNNSVEGKSGEGEEKTSVQEKKPAIETSKLQGSPKLLDTGPAVKNFQDQG